VPFNSEIEKHIFSFDTNYIGKFLSSVVHHCPHFFKIRSPKPLNGFLPNFTGMILRCSINGSGLLIHRSHELKKDFKNEIIS
jgi:hypothetical protein